MIVELALLVLLLVILRLYVFKSKAQQTLDKFPGPRSYPIIGNLLDFDYPKTEITETLKELSFKYGPAYFIKLGTEPVVALRNPEDVELILGSTSLIDKAPLYWPLLPWLNEGLLTSKGEKWKRHRKVLTPAFHFKILEKFTSTFDKNGTILAEKLSKMVGREIDIVPHISLCALDIICESAMGLEVNAQLKESTYVNSVNELLEIIAHRNFHLIQRTFLFPLLPTGRRHNQLVSYLHNATKKVMKERKVKLEATEIDEESISDDFKIGIKKKKAFLDLLLEYNKEGAGMTDDEIREEVDTFMFEGYDTTTSTISFCLFCLSQNPEVQERAYDEMKSIFGDSDKEASYQDLLEMKYLEKVIKETLRRYPTVPFVGRKGNQEIRLKSGFTIPKDTSIMVLIETMGHDPEIFPDPLKFDPERFNQKSSNPYAFVPFSAGIRNCIGQKYAIQEVKSIVSRILRKFHLLPSDKPITPWFNLVMKSKTGVWLKLEHRKTT